MECVQLPLWRDSAIESRLDRYPDSDPGKKPALLVIPGGGYGNVCETTEGQPVAECFRKFGFRTFVLRYRVAPHRYPAPQQDALRAIKLIRAHADAWGVIPDQLAVCGFSAGAHLTACTGTLHDRIPAADGDTADTFSGRPDAMLLAYPVISFTNNPHQGSVTNLLGPDAAWEDMERLSLERQITGDTPPAFVWHTATDQIVPFRNSLLFADAMWRANRRCELHLFPYGPHGMQLGYGRDDIRRWPEQAAAFLRTGCGFDLDLPAPRRTVVLTFDDAVKNHLTFVAPLLKEHGFGATFFPCRFSDEWRGKNEAHLLTGAELRQLHDMGFEIGNHTWSHPDMRTLPAEDAGREIDQFNRFLADSGIPLPKSFAYPGGPFAENIVPLLKERGFSAARTTAQRPWRKSSDDPMRIPAFPVSQDDRLGFFRALSCCREDNAVVLVFHGIPDSVHPWVNNSPECFREYMEYLDNEGFRVVSMAEYLAE